MSCPWTGGAGPPVERDHPLTLTFAGFSSVAPHAHEHLSPPRYGIQMRVHDRSPPPPEALCQPPPLCPRWGTLGGGGGV